jgi:site-specific recombinase XerD
MMLPVPVGQRALAKRFSQLPKYFSFDEVDRILSDSLKREHYDDWFLCNFMWQTGTRVSEALSVLHQDIDYTARTARVVTLKRTAHERIIPLKPEFLLEIQLYRQHQEQRQTTKRRDLRKIFNYNRATAYNYVVEACALAGIRDDRAHPHTFRHSFAVNCLIHGVPITKLQQWLGHANILNTLIYTVLAGREDHVILDSVEFKHTA